MLDIPVQCDAMNKSYAKGRRFEWRVRDYLRKNGYFVVRQAKSAFPDLIAFNDEEVLVIECKWNGNLSSSEILKMTSIWAKICGHNAFYKFILASNVKGKIKFENMFV